MLQLNPWMASVVYLCITIWRMLKGLGLKFLGLYIIFIRYISFSNFFLFQNFFEHIFEHTFLPSLSGLSWNTEIHRPKELTLGTSSIHLQQSKRGPEQLRVTWSLNLRQYCICCNGKLHHQLISAKYNTTGLPE